VKVDKLRARKSRNQRGYRKSRNQRRSKSINRRRKMMLDGTDTDTDTDTNIFVRGYWGVFIVKVHHTDKVQTLIDKCKLYIGEHKDRIVTGYSYTFTEEGLNSLKLRFNQEVLDPNQTIDKSGIRNESTVWLILPLKL
jgi:hypothetical protein